MKTSNWMKKFAAIAGSAVIGLILAAGANAANPEPVVAQVTFANPVTISEVAALRYGIIDVALNLETIIIAPDSGESGTGTSLLLGGTRGAANLTIGAEASQVLTIVVDSIAPGTGYTLTSFVCNYNGGTDTACNSYNPTAIGSAALLIGATLTGTNSASVGAANGSFDVTVAYQ